MNLVELQRMVESNAQHIDLPYELAKYEISDPNVINWFSGPKIYYHMLASYCQLMGPKRVLDLGTAMGASALALAKYSKQVYSYDLEKWPTTFDSLDKFNIKPILLDNADDILDIDLAGIDLIYVDIDHSGEMELKLHAKFLAEYKGLVFWDDVVDFEGMERFWKTIENDKLILPWHSSGFGVVSY